MAVTLVVGTTVLAGTIAAPSGSRVFFGLGLLSAAVWTAGALLSGPIHLGPRRVAAILVGVVLFGAFFVAKLIADQIPLLSGSVTRVLARADTGPTAYVLALALLNGVGEELFFRGAVHSAAGGNHAAARSTIVYCVVTIATLNLALVAAALVIGAVCSLERRSTGGVAAPILTHVSWSALMLLFLPR